MFTRPPMKREQLSVISAREEVLGVPAVHEIADYSPQLPVDFIYQGSDYLPGRAEERSQKAISEIPYFSSNPSRISG